MFVKLALINWFCCNKSSLLYLNNCCCCCWWWCCWLVFWLNSVLVSIIPEISLVLVVICCCCCFIKSLLTGSCVVIILLPEFWHYVTIGRNSVCWVSLWRRKSTFLWKARPHRSQANGLNPVCLRECVIKFDDWLNALPHTVHLWGFSPETNMKKNCF